MSKLQFVAASPRHASLVRGYWCVDDWAGEHLGKPITTGPCAGSVITVNVGRPNRRAGGADGPRVSLAGLYTRLHHWQSCEQTCFVMVMLSPMGMARLFPSVGRASVDRVLDVGGLLGDRAAQRLEAALSRSQVGAAHVNCVEQWIDERLESSPFSYRQAAVGAAIVRLAEGENVDATADSLGLSRRTLYNWTTSNLGIGPKALASLARLERSISAVQRGRGDPLDGYSDQAHQIRDWRRHVQQTPGRYAQSQQSELALKFRRAAVNDLTSGVLYL